MASRYQNFIKGIGLVPNATDQNALKGDLNVTSGNGKLNYHNGTSSSPAVTEAHTAELTNKTIGDSLPFKGSTSGTTTLIAKAVASGTLTLPASTDTLVGETTSATLTNKTIAAGSNTISGLTNANLSGTAGITNANLANSTISGISLGSNLADLTVSTGLSLNSGTTYNGGTAKTISIDSTVVTLNGSQVLTNKTISGTNNTLSNIANSSLTNSSITVNGSTIALGGSATITANTTNALTIGTGLSGTSFNGSAAVTIAIDSSVVTLTGGQSLSNKTLVNPVIDDTLVSIATKDLKINAATTKNVLLQNEGNTIATVASNGLTLASNAQLTLANNAQTVGIKASPSASASYTITLPAAAPTSGTAIIYDGTNYVWSSAGGWNSSIQNALSNGGAVTISLSQGQQVIEVAGASGPVTLSTTPFGGSAPNDKTVVRLFGTSDTNTVTISSSDIAKGVYVNGQAVLFLGYVIDFMYISSIDRWMETSRNF